MVICCLFFVSEVHLTCVYIIFRSVLVAGRPPLEKKLLTRLTICYLCILVLRSRFGF